MGLIVEDLLWVPSRGSVTGLIGKKKAELGAHSRASWPKVIRAKLSLPPIPSKGFVREHWGMYIGLCNV